jgi:hypothetical protein
MSLKYQKADDEPLLFINPETGIYFLRKRQGKTDTHVSLQTTKIVVARKLRDDYKSAIRLRKLGLLPAEDAQNESTPPVERAANVTVAEEKPAATPTTPPDLITSAVSMQLKKGHRSGTDWW